MSLQAELVRLGTRAFIKHRSKRNVPLAERRKEMQTYEDWVPRAPKSVVTTSLALGGATAVSVSVPEALPGRRVLFLHGGGYTSGSAKLYRHITWRIARACRSQLVVVNYRLAPENPFPAALEDAFEAWRALLADGCDAQCCAFLGDSAGGGLALALALKARDEGAPLPAAMVALSPWTDLAMTGATDRSDDDPVLNFDDLAPLAASYLAGADARHPYASPLYGDLHGLPPTLIQVGSDEILLDDSVRMAERLRAAGCDATLEIWPRMPHVWHAFAPFMPEARRAIARVGAFAEGHLG